MKLLRITLIFACLAHTALLADQNQKVRDQPYLSFQFSGGHSSYRKASVEIQFSGDAQVRIAKGEKPAFSYRTELSKEEIGTLNTLVASTRFFSQQDQRSAPVTDTGETEITVAEGTERKTLRFRYLPEMAPLSDFLWKLVNQADALTSIGEDDDIYTAVGSVNPRTAGFKVLQPDRFQVPLFAYVNKSKDPQRVRWALESLAWITTPERFAGLIANEIGDPKRRDVMLLAIPGYGNLPEQHWKALCPMYLDFIRKNHSRLKELTAAEHSAYQGFVDSLGIARYAPSIPLFVSWFEERDQLGLTSDITPLAKMGLPGLRALIPYLDSPKEIYRGNAIELLAIASRGNPRSQYAFPYSESEYAAMIPLFQTTILPKLSAISESDLSPKVRKAAAEALPEIRSEIEKK